MTAPAANLDDFSLQHRLRVRWSEVDMQGIVFFAQYHTYFDIAQAEYFRALGPPYQSMYMTAEHEIFIRRTECEYFESARFDEELIVGARVARMGRSSLHMAFAVCRDDTLLAKGAIVYVFAHPATRRTCPVPARLRAAITAFEVLPPAT